MTTSIKKDLETIAADVIRAITRLETDAKEQLEAIENDETTKPAVLDERRAEVIRNVGLGYNRIRAEYGRKVDALTAKLRMIGDGMKPKPTADAATMALLNVLQNAPTVTPIMLQDAAQQVGGDPFGQDVLRSISQRHGLTMPQLAPIDKHLSGGDLYQLADDAQDAFRAYFDSRTAFIDPDAKQNLHDYDGRQQLLTMAKRSNSEYGLRTIGSMFDFGGNSDLQSEFATLSAE